jgi:hypothetical protein
VESDREENTIEDRRTQKGKGRAVNGDEEESDDHDAEEEDEQEEGRPIQSQYRPEYERHPDGYVLDRSLYRNLY